ncbi:hypothetical protein QYS48_30190 [Marivirga arenosa]|uniref:Uncharacterized protein n=1 Tax=Marivirga arenosa TaxID=3059076 RepID=A0AA51N8G0_9BACT|nr:hypothetical protein [Marivirga sp. ABR2-2]WMN07874.1 hypothetical protein QYS48_30190 [Marivirga sp. ABR2-2]
MKYLATIILTFIATLSWSQTNNEFSIFTKIIEQEASNGKVYIHCDKPKTYFNTNELIEQTGLQIPQNTLNELKESVLTSRDGVWDQGLIQSLNSSFLKSKNCLTKEATNELFRETGERQKVVSISEPVFDQKSENCIISVTIQNYLGSASGYSYFLSKVYGTWTIVATFNPWIT